MKRISILSILILSALSLSACSTVTTTSYQKPNGVYQVISLSRSENDGAPAALKKARDICQKQHKQMIVIHNRTRYQGSNKELGELSDVISQTAFMTGEVNIPSMRQNNDYKTVVSFRCR